MLDSWYTGQTLIFGHRGASAYAPMNTLPAFEQAVEQGADGIELDVHRSQDGHAVIVHDFTVDSTTDGSGKVAEMTLAQLKELDAGSWFSDEFRNTRLPTLDEVFEAVGSKLYINVEIKSNAQETDGVEQVVADVIARHALQECIIVSSFNPLALKRFRDMLPNVPIGFLYSADVPVDTHQMMRELKLSHEARHPHHDLVDVDYMEWARKNGYLVNAWTVNDLERAVALRNLGVDAIITDKPIDLLRALRGE